uniref:Uncharacterized protein n=1 Tax=Ciona intestinalis TaxID=7719 RepID=F7AG05_CIOIN
QKFGERRPNRGVSAGDQGNQAGQVDLATVLLVPRTRIRIQTRIREANVGSIAEEEVTVAIQINRTFETRPFKERNFYITDIKFKGLNLPVFFFIMKKVMLTSMFISSINVHWTSVFDVPPELSIYKPANRRRPTPTTIVVSLTTNTQSPVCLYRIACNTCEHGLHNFID